MLVGLVIECRGVENRQGTVLHGALLFICASDPVAHPPRDPKIHVNHRALCESTPNEAGFDAGGALSRIAVIESVGQHLMAG